MSLLFFYSKVCSSNKKPKKYYTLFVKPTCFLLIQETRRSMTNFWTKLTLTILDKYWHSRNLFYCKIYTRGVFRIQSNICNKSFSWFLQRCPTVDILLCSKYAFPCIYIQVSPKEIISHIILSMLNIFAVKYIFLTKEEWDKVAISKLKEIL